MLHARNLAHYLWGEATRAAVHIKNRTATETLQGLTPFEKWYGKKPSVDHLRIFGCDADTLVPKGLRTKWEFNSVKCLMVGYSEGNKAYRLYDPASRQVLIRRDDIFHETAEDPGIEFANVETSGENVLKQKTPEKEGEGENTQKEKLKYRNPRLPIPRSPYQTRRASAKSNEDDTALEQAEIAEIFMVNAEPVNVREAMATDDSEKWLAAINAELDSLEQNETWTLVPRPKDKNVITNRWVLKKKLKSNGQVDKYKARLVARGCSQQKGIDYAETFAPVVKYSSVRALLSVAAAKDLEIFQFDVKTAFLQGELQEEIYMEQPSDFETSDKMCLLKKSLYGLKQASRQWNKQIVDYLVNSSFRRSSADPCVFLSK